MHDMTTEFFCNSVQLKENSYDNSFTL